jgi:hypothetical protein
MMLALGAVSIPTRMMNAVFPSTILALREAVSVVAAAAMADGADGLSV